MRKEVMLRFYTRTISGEHFFANIFLRTFNFSEHEWVQHRLYVWFERELYL
jgi:hypothetical protein